MSKKKLIKKELDLILNEVVECKLDKLVQERLIESLKEIARQVLTVVDYEEVFGVKLIER